MPTPTETPEFQYPAYVYRATVIKIVDGDTIDVKIDVGFRMDVYKRLRFLKIDTWEVRGAEREKGLLAKARLVELLDGVDIYIQTVMDATGKYGRLLAWVWTEKDGVLCNVIEVLLEEGHGVIYGSK